MQRRPQGACPGPFFSSFMNCMKWGMNDENNGLSFSSSITSLNNLRPTARAVAASALKSPRLRIRSTIAKMSSWLRTSNCKVSGVPDMLLQELYDLMKWGPTSMNASPMRVLFLRTPDAKERLVPALAPGNIEKARTAPVVEHSVLCGQSAESKLSLRIGIWRSGRLVPQASTAAFRRGLRIALAVVRASKIQRSDVGAKLRRLEWLVRQPLYARTTATSLRANDMAALT